MAGKLRKIADDQGEACMMGNCHRHATWEDDDEIFCSVHVREDPRWDEPQDKSA